MGSDGGRGLVDARMGWWRRRGGAGAGLGHHADGVFERLTLVAEPDSDHLALVAQLLSQGRDLSAWGTKRVR